MQTSLYADDLIAAYNARSDTENYNRLGQSAFIETIQNAILRHSLSCSSVLESVTPAPSA